MASDIKLLDGNQVLVEGADLFIDRGQEQNSVAINLKNPTGFWHISGPRTFDAGNPLSIFWNNNTQWSGPYLTINTSGNVGIGTPTPVRRLQVEGSEIHSGGSGAGFSFGDRTAKNFVDNPSKGERWVWYSQGGTACLWAGEDKLLVNESGQLTALGGLLSFDHFNVGNPLSAVNGKQPASTFWGDIYAYQKVGIGTTKPMRPLHVEDSEIHSGGSGAGFSFGDRTAKNFVDSPSKGERWVWYAEDGTARLWAGEDKLSVDSKGGVRINGGFIVWVPKLNSPKISATVPSISTGIQQDPAVLPDIIVPAFSVDDKTGNVGIGVLSPSVEHQLDVKGNTRIAGNLTATTVTNTSSKTLKENIIELSAQEAMTALTDLNPIKFNFKADDTKELHVGFIAEDVPELVAMDDRKTLSSMDIVAVLTKVVQEQHQQISQLVIEVNTLKQAQATT